MTEYISKFKKFGVSIHDCIHVHVKTVVAKSDDFRFNHYNLLETHDTKFCKNKLHIKFRDKFNFRRGRINCSLNDDIGWRWLGIQFSIESNE